MSTPMSYTDFAKDVLVKLEAMEKRQIKMAKQIEEMYYDAEPPARDGSNVEQVEDVDIEFIKKNGELIPYYKIDDPKNVADFRKFIYFARTNYRKLTDQEMQYVDYANKNFEDIRLTRKHIGILQGVYSKLYNKTWPFETKPGTMFKYGTQIAWEWYD